MTSESRVTVTSTTTVGGVGQPTLGALRAFVEALQGQDPNLPLRIVTTNSQMEGQNWSITASPVQHPPVQAPHWGHKPGCRCPNPEPHPSRRGTITPSGLDMTEGGTR